MHIFGNIPEMLYFSWLSTGWYQPGLSHVENALAPPSQGPLVAMASGFSLSCNWGKQSCHILQAGSFMSLQQMKLGWILRRLLPDLQCYVRPVTNSFIHFASGCLPCPSFILTLPGPSVQEQGLALGTLGCFGGGDVVCQRPACSVLPEITKTKHPSICFNDMICFNDTH